MTDKELAEIRARCDAATPGPWEPTSCSQCDTFHVRQHPPRNGFCMDEGASTSDYLFIANARSDIPALLAEVERLRGELECAADELHNATNALIAAGSGIDAEKAAKAEKDARRELDRSIMS